MQESNVAANTQVTDVDLAYLAGLWDGEGHIGIIYTRRRKGISHYATVAGICNSNADIIVKVIEILDGLKIAAHIEARKQTKPYHKPSYFVKINKHVALKKLVETLIPYLVGKKGVAKLMLRYVNSRLKRTEADYRAPYTEKEISLYEQIKQLNQKGTSEAIRRTEIKDMVQAL